MSFACTVRKILPAEFRVWGREEGRGWFWFCCCLTELCIREMTTTLILDVHVLLIKIGFKNLYPKSRICMETTSRVLKWIQTYSVKCGESQTPDALKQSVLICSYIIITLTV